MKKDLGIFAIFAVLCIVLAILNPKFLGAVNLQNIARIVGIYGIFSIGVGMVIITGGIDLSIGSLLSLLGILLTFMLVPWGWPWPLAVLAILLMGLIIGLFHGFLITRLKLQSFIVTLCGLLAYRGLARFIAEDQTQGFGTAQGFEWLKELATRNVAGVPMPFILMLGIAAITWVVLHRSIYGRYLFAVGRNEQAARYSGINTRRVIFGAYVISAVLTALSAILLAFYTNSVSPSSHGNFYELYAIAAAVLGGCSLRGGEGSVIGIVIGAALLQVIQNLVNLLGIPSSLNFAVMGVVILIGAISDQLLQGQSTRRKSA